MSGFLDRMAESSRTRMTQACASEPLANLRSRALAAAPAPALRLANGFNLIAEFKRRSPALGKLGDDDITDRASTYARAGAIAVSVLTEPSEFQGSLAHLETAATALGPASVPVLRKDFLVDPYQLFEARAAGAGGVLLIVRMLSRNLLGEMIDCARELNLFVLLEAFDAADIERAAAVTARSGGIRPGSPLARSGNLDSLARGDPATSPDRAAETAVLLGVNCRDLRSLETRPDRFRELATLLPQDAVCVAESGITTPDDCAEVARLGFDVALVGGALMTSPDPAGVIRTMLAAGRAVT
jgi:indole-3-glycerol phosphate synthase